MEALTHVGVEIFFKNPLARGRVFLIYYALVRRRGGQIIENRKLGNQRELQLIYETSEDKTISC